MNELNSGQISKIKEIIEKYKEFMSTEQGKEELFKWTGLAHFRVHWDIDAVDFREMLKESFGRMESLLTSGTYYPIGMLLDYSDQNPEGLREAFRRLYDNDRPLSERYEEFCVPFQKYIDERAQRDGKQIKHFQDPRAVLWYLTLRYPERYFPYKYSVYQNALRMIGYSAPAAKKRTPIWKAECSQEFSQLLLDQIKQDAGLVQMHKERLPELWKEDPELHLLVFDILFYAEKYMADSEDMDGYWPRLDDYDPEITTEQWEELLQDHDVTHEDSLEMLAMMMQEGGESTCAHLAEKYGNTYAHYNSCGKQFAARVKKKLDCPDCIDNGIIRYFPVAFMGRRVDEDGNKRYSWRIRDELQEALRMMDLPKYPEQPVKSAQEFAKNMILYGPPGTGKTYHTVLYAVAIIEGKALETVETEDYSKVVQRYRAYKKEGRIEFTTFHQSYGYEDFVEGIRPVFEDEADDRADASAIHYRVEPGVFQKFCDTALKSSITGREEYQLNENPAIWKVSLEGTGDNETRRECMENGHIRIGWDDYGEDLSTLKDYYQGGSRVLNAFYNRMEIGDLVFSCYSATQIDAIGVIIGNPEWDNTKKQYKRTRKVHWIAKNLSENIREINGGHAMVQGAVYELWRISLEDAYKLIEKHSTHKKQDEVLPEKPYVFIIDEINRGNISKIFGELITLMEGNKRIGAEEETRVRLPYSNRLFGVPKNVYIIGTMNTADRSIMALDTALRRRFRFEEMLPDPKTVLNGVTIEQDGCCIEVDRLLERMNERIEALYDREHTIGHAYFTPLKDRPEMDFLAEIFKNQVIPLLQEYFFDDYEKIRLVLGDNQKQSGDGTEFITVQKDDYQELFGSYDVQQEAKTRYMIDWQAVKKAESYRFLC